MYPSSKPPPNKLHPARIPYNDERHTSLRHKESEYRRRAQKIHKARSHENQTIHQHYEKATAHFEQHNGTQQEFALLQKQTQARLDIVDKKYADIAEELNAKWAVVRKGATWEEVDVSTVGNSEEIP